MMIGFGYGKIEDAFDLFRQIKRIAAAGPTT
jgi:hypothetical protein